MFTVEISEISEILLIIVRYLHNQNNVLWYFQRDLFSFRILQYHVVAYAYTPSAIAVSYLHIPLAFEIKLDSITDTNHNEKTSRKILLNYLDFLFIL